MKTIAFALLTGILSTAINSVAAENPGAQQKTSVNSDVLMQLADTDWRIRDKAVASISSTTINGNTRSALINLLDQENALREKWYLEKAQGKNPESPAVKFGDGYGEYYGDLVMKVAALHTSQADGSLVGALDTLGNKKIIEIFGEDSVPALAEKFKASKNSYLRSRIVETLGKLSADKIKAEKMRQKAKAVVFEAADDGDQNVRRSAIKSLHFFGTAEAVKKLQEISAKDAYSIVRKDDKQKVFPNREAAQKEIERLTKETDGKQ